MRSASKARTANPFQSYFLKITSPMQLTRGESSRETLRSSEGSHFALSRVERRRPRLLDEGLQLRRLLVRGADADLGRDAELVNLLVGSG